MRRLVNCLAALALLVATGVTVADGFSVRIAVTPAAGARVFHHPDSAGRKNIAVSAGSVAVVWEDNRDGSPQVYWAVRAPGESAFRDERRLSSGTESYEPSIAALAGGRFVVAWEQDERIVARGVSARGELGPTVTIGDLPARQVSLAPLDADGVAVALMQQIGKHRRVMVTRVRMGASSEGLESAPLHPVETDPPRAEQLYPSLAVSPAGWCVAWEDRRHGHTRLLWSHARDGVAFTPPRALNEFYANRSEFDRGSGVTRVALARFGERGVAAVWMDKREGGKAYAIVGAVSEDGGRDFGPRLRIHDDFGDETLHYHPAVAGNAAGRLVTVWDDLRDDNADLWLSEYADGRWGDNRPVDPARTAVEESNASIALDDSGELHAVWIEKPTVEAATRLWYAHGR
ncbi:MAG: hypothetical protein ACFCUG_10445 [Thiotrichales bacterium]